MTLNLFDDEPLPIDGVRDWFHVDDHAEAIWPSTARLHELRPPNKRRPRRGSHSRSSVSSGFSRLGHTNPKHLVNIRTNPAALLPRYLHEHGPGIEGSGG